MRVERRGQLQARPQAARSPTETSDEAALLFSRRSEAADEMLPALLPRPDQLASSCLARRDARLSAQKAEARAARWKEAVRTAVLSAFSLRSLSRGSSRSPLWAELRVFCRPAGDGEWRVRSGSQVLMRGRVLREAGGFEKRAKGGRRWWALPARARQGRTAMNGLLVAALAVKGSRRPRGLAHRPRRVKRIERKKGQSRDNERRGGMEGACQGAEAAPVRSARAGYDRPRR